jgi:sugar lactone lactonase YvrE
MLEPRLLTASLLLAGLLAACADPELEHFDGGVPGDSGADIRESDSFAFPDQRPPGDGGSGQGWKLYAHDQTRLFSLDALKLKSGKPNLVVVGNFSFAPSIPANERSVNDIAMTADGKLYAVTKTFLYEVDPKTAALTKVAEVRDKQQGTPPPMVSLTFEASGRLLASDMDGALLRIHTSGANMGLVEEIGSYGQGQGSSGDLVAIRDGTLYGASQKGLGASKENNNLIRVDPSTGAAARIGPIGHGYVWGLAYWAGVIYGFTSERNNRGKLLRIDPQTGKGTLLLEAPYYPYQFWGAAVTPLAPIK